MARGVLTFVDVSTSLDAVRLALREATEHFLVGDAPALVDELTDALLSASDRVGRLRKIVAGDHPMAEQIHEMDRAFGQSVSLARSLSTAIRSHRDPGAYTDATAIVRELARQLAASLPRGPGLTVRHPSNAVIVAMPPSELRRILATLVRCTVEDLGVGGRGLWLEVRDLADKRSPASGVHIIVGHASLGAGRAADAADQVRHMVNARGGSVEPCAAPGGGTAVVVSVPGAC